MSAPARVRTIMHAGPDGELSTYHVELPEGFVTGDRPLDRTVRAAYLQGFAAGAQYVADREKSRLQFEDATTVGGGESPVE